MGYVSHHAIIVTSWSGKDIAAAHAEAVRIFGASVSSIITSQINEFRSFMVAPDGSKGGWSESDDGDNRRAEFIKCLREGPHICGDGSSSLEWVCVQYGNDDRGAKIDTSKWSRP